MSGVARILLDRGALVSGSDAKESRGLHALRARGAQIRIGHDASSLDLLEGGVTAVITTHAAIPKTNPELVEARRRGIPVVLRPAVLASLMDGRTTLMVTGTHGKTTTTSMLIVALQHCGRDPSFAVGGELGEAGTNAHHGSGDCFVAEADESDGSLLEYTPDVAVVTNIESDHLDFYGSPDAYIGVFDAFMERLAAGGALVVCTDDPGAAALAQRTAELGIRVLRYGSVERPGAALAGTLLSWEQQGTEAVAHIQLASELDPVAHPRVMRLSVPGRHMALNALGALLAAIEIGAPADQVLDGLAGFEGVRRRLELVGTTGAGKVSVRVFDDYAHHPTEVSATLAAVRTVVEQSGDGRLLVVFQPHLYSRTKAFAVEFGHALDAADQVFVLDVYGAREQPLAGVSGASVAGNVSVPVRYLPDFSAVAEEVAAAAGPGDVIVTMGAGDVTLLGPEIVTALRVRANRSAPGRPGVV
jgi:UDP-N-acetylmuramate--alanine ligase